MAKARKATARKGKQQKRTTVAREQDHARLAGELRELVETACPGIAVEVGIHPRWQRKCFTFRWAGFDGLLPEERFRLVVKRIPPEFYEAHCGGAVWLELADGESLEDYLELPRSEDIDPRLAAVWSFLRDVNFFATLEDELVRIPPARCPDDFTVCRKVLTVKQASADQARDALLAFMRHRAYSDWEVLREVRPLVENNKDKDKKK
jgi:hypothetical protein